MASYEAISQRPPRPTQERCPASRSPQAGGAVTSAPKCRVCAQPREPDDEGWMCRGCHAALAIDVAFVRSIPGRVLGALRSARKGWRDG